MIKACFFAFLQTQKQTWGTATERS